MCVCVRVRVCLCVCVCVCATCTFGQCLYLSKLTLYLIASCSGGLEFGGLTDVLGSDPFYASSFTNQRCGHTVAVHGLSVCVCVRVCVIDVCVYVCMLDVCVCFVCVCLLRVCVCLVCVYMCVCLMCVCCVRVWLGGEALDNYWGGSYSQVKNHKARKPVCAPPECMCSF